MDRDAMMARVGRHRDDRLGERHDESTPAARLSYIDPSTDPHLMI